MNVVPANLEDCLQPNLRHPSPIHSKRDKFEKAYGKYGFKYVYYRYGDIGLFYKLRKLKMLIKKILRV